jgi:hypothetical protein
VQYLKLSFCSSLYLSLGILNSLVPHRRGRRETTIVCSTGECTRKGNTWRFSPLKSSIVLLSKSVYILFSSRPGSDALRQRWFQFLMLIVVIAPFMDAIVNTRDVLFHQPPRKMQSAHNSSRHPEPKLMRASYRTWTLVRWSYSVPFCPMHRWVSFRLAPVRSYPTYLPVLCMNASPRVHERP